MGEKVKAKEREDLVDVTNATCVKYFSSECVNENYMSHQKDP